MTLLHYRLRWYAASTARLLLRRWQAVALALGILAPAGAGLFTNIEALAYPLTILFAPAHQFAWRYGYLALLQGLAVLWVLMQRDQIAGGRFMQFVGSLPFAQRHKRMVDVAVLALADSPLWVPVLAAFVVSGQFVHLVFVAAFVMLALAAQLAALERKYATWAVVVVANLFLAGGLGAIDAPGMQLALLLVAGLAGCALIWVPLPRPHSSWRRGWPRRAAPLLAMLLELCDRMHPALLIALSILYRQRRSEALGKMMAALCVAGAAVGLMALWDYDARAFPLALMAQAAIALLISGLYRSLHMAHLGAAAYCAALPLAHQWWRRYDTQLVVALALPFMLTPVAFALYYHAAPAVSLLLGTASNAVLLAALRLPQVHAERHAVIMSAVGAALWTAITITLLN
jgi:hypothetical protein